MLALNQPNYTNTYIYTHLPVKGSSNQWETPNEHDELHWLETGGPDLLSEHCHYYLVKTNIAMEKSTIFKFSKPSISMGHLYHGYVKSGYVSHNQRVNSTSFSTGDLSKIPEKNTSLTEKIPLRKNQTRWENPPSFSDFRERFPAILLGISRPCLMTKLSQESGDVFFLVEPWSESHQREGDNENKNL